METAAKITWERVLEALESGEYTQEYIDDCGCSWDWHIDDSGRLDDGRDPADCWSGYSLYVADQHICDLISCEGIQNPSVDLDPEWRELIEGICSPGLDNLDNDIHDERQRDSLIAWLLEGNYILDRADGCFANEYTMILRAATEGDEPPTEADAAEWADAYLWSGDDATQAYVGFELLT